MSSQSKNGKTFSAIYQYDRNLKNPPKHTFRSLCLEEIELLSPGNVLLVVLNNGNIGNCRVSGQVKRWKRDTDRIAVPCKYGLYESHTFTNVDYHRLVIEVESE